MLYVLPPSFAERKEVECGNWIWGTPEARGNGCHLKSFSWNGFLFLCSFFGHFSHRSEWQLIKIDYKSIYGRKCAEEDYQTWHLHNQVGNQIAICLKETDNFLVKRTLCHHNLLTTTGRALCNGTKTNFHETKTWKLLHAGEGLLQNPLSRVLHLPSSWFWMVRWDSHTICSSFFFCSYWLVINLHYMIERMKRLQTTQQKAVEE